ncbi:MAG: hypothetical protein GY852_06740 [bacterium]|nr:hypothetical protein [bacterium]
MKNLLFILCFVAFLSATMIVEVEEKGFATLVYHVEEAGALDSTLTVVVMEGDTQQTVQEVTGFNGLYTGEVQVMEPGTYTVKVYNLNTGQDGEATINFAPQEKLLPTDESVEQLKEQAAEEHVSLEPITEQYPWLIYLIVVLFVIIVAMLLFGNPLKKPKKKK